MQGVPKDVTSEGTLRACLGEIDRCYAENIMPFFVNMTRSVTLSTFHRKHVVVVLTGIF